MRTLTFYAACSELRCLHDWTRAALLPSHFERDDVFVCLGDRLGLVL
jgi:hypothetical protein